jgi:hypothetical protein
LNPIAEAKAIERKVPGIFAETVEEGLLSASPKAGALAASLLEIGEKIEDTNSIEALDALQEQFEAILKQVFAGLRDGTVSADGLDSFRLGYEFVRDTLRLHRETLMRRAGPDDHMVVIAKAFS